MKIRLVLFLSSIFMTASSAYAQNPTEKFLNSIDDLMKIESIAFGERSDDEIIERIKENVRGKLRDPDSAEFRRVTLKREEEAIYACGQVNAKNAFGGYTGFKWFFATPISMFHSEQDNTGQIVIAHYCAP